MTRLISLPTLVALAACSAVPEEDAALVIVDEIARMDDVHVEISGAPMSEALPVWVGADERARLVTPEEAFDLDVAAGEVVMVRGPDADLTWLSATHDLDRDAVAVVATDEAALELAEILGAHGFSELDGLRIIDAPDALYAAAGLRIPDVWETVPMTLQGEPVPGWLDPTSLRCACDMGLDLDLDLSVQSHGEPTTVTVVHEIALTLDDDLVAPVGMPFLGNDLDSFLTEGGTLVRVLAPGDGPVVQDGHRVTVDYVGTLENGEVFDATDARGPATLPLWGVIDGFREGLLGMRVGERRVLVIPPEQGYGDRDIGPIPPDSTLVFDVHLLATVHQDAWLE